VPAADGKREMGWSFPRPISGLGVNSLPAPKIRWFCQIWAFLLGCTYPKRTDGNPIDESRPAGRRRFRERNANSWGPILNVGIVLSRMKGRY
jgi:hypothetical protein